MKKSTIFALALVILTLSTATTCFADFLIEPYVIPVDAYITPYTSYFYPGASAYKTAYWGGGNNIYSGYIDACISHNKDSEDVWIKVGSVWHDDIWRFSYTSKLSQDFYIARFDTIKPGTTHKQKLYVASEGASASAYSVVIER